MAPGCSALSERAAQLFRSQWQARGPPDTLRQGIYLAAFTAQADHLSYARSKERYTQLLKDTALCRNRGGEQLAGLWGNLMVYGTVPGVNPCGDINLANYFQ